MLLNEAPSANVSVVLVEGEQTAKLQSCVDLIFSEDTILAMWLLLNFLISCLKVYDSGGYLN